MKHALEDDTRAVIRGIITTIRCRNNVTKAEAERLFCKALTGHSDSVDAIIKEVDDIIADEKET